MNEQRDNNDVYEKIMDMCKELDLKVDTVNPLDRNTYLSAWNKRMSAD